MKQTLTQPPVIPAGYTGLTFNSWQKYLQQQLDKIKNTDLSKRLVQFD